MIPGHRQTCTGFNILHQIGLNYFVEIPVWVGKPRIVSNLTQLIKLDNSLDWCKYKTLKKAVLNFHQGKENFVYQLNWVWGCNLKYERKHLEIWRHVIKQLHFFKSMFWHNWAWYESDLISKKEQYESDKVLSGDDTASQVLRYIGEIIS